ncbi:MAG TPA: DUF1570 domain-containing protein [Gemmataceae bacterium]|nr:DUF1570 domain-containing protein [Gemmataceae bacterium]
MNRRLLAVCAAAAFAAPALAAPGDDDWKYDVVHLKKGDTLNGLVVEQDARHVFLRVIVRKPGAPTLIFSDDYQRSEVDHIDLLNAEDRAELAKRLDALVREHDQLTMQLKLLDPDASRGQLASGDALKLQPAAWPADPKAKALAYQSTYFRLVSDARPELVQLAAVNLEQVYAAYGRALPPRVMAPEPTTILLAQSLKDYQALVAKDGRNLFNPAYFDPAKNEIVCASDLQRMADVLQDRRRDAEKALADLADKEKQLNQAYKGHVPPEELAPINEARKKINAITAQNEEAFNRARRRLVQRLYHEAFHAYLSNAVYTPADGEAPRWLNEGLAQVFETAVYEVGELRIGRPDKDRLEAVHAAIGKGTLLPTADLIRADYKQFAVVHASEKEASDRYYLASWALAFDLAFNRKLLGTKQLDDYVHALKRGAPPLDAFHDLVGEPLADFEKEHLEYLKSLRSE